MQPLTIHLFGPPQFFLGDKPGQVDRRKTLALVARLACGPPEGCSREMLSALLWPDASQEQASAYLRQALWDFSKQAGEGWVEREGPLVRFRHEAELRIDVQVFEDRLARWKDLAHGDPSAIPLLEEAARLYTGDFLAGFSLRDSPDFDAWQMLEAEGLRIRLGEALEGLASLYSAQQKPAEALACARRWLALDPLNEAAHRALMRLYDVSGQRGAALRQYDACQRKLQEELGVAPEAETTRLFAAISARRAATQPSEANHAPSEGMHAPVPVFLPAQPTPFLGREDELARIKEMLDSPECRLVSLVGPGGSGKTRLAIQAAGQSMGYPRQMNFPHGIYFASLAGAASPEDMLARVAGGLKLDLHSDFREGLTLDSALAQLRRFLAEKKMLLVLDNLEQAAGSAGLLSGLLGEAPGVKFITTSRVRLHLPEEWVLEVGGLPYPGSTNLTGIEQFAAIQVFLKTAQRAAGFHPSPADWGPITRICQAIDGLPLGIELAASWVKMLSCAEIADEITRDLDFLAGTHPGEPQGRSLRAVFDQSWRLLTENERAIFARLSVFRGGFTREAAYQVAGASLSILSAFADHSLLRRVSSGRFDLHGMVKQYAAEKLAAVPASQAETQTRHAAYYAGWMHQMSAQLCGPGQNEALAALRAESQNLRGAWRELVEGRQYHLLGLIQVDVILFYEMQGYYSAGNEMMRILIETLRQEECLPDDENHIGLLGLALAAMRHFERVLQTPENDAPLQYESLALARRLPPSATRGYILILNSTINNVLSPQQIAGLCQESAQIFQASGDCWGSGLAHLVLGDIATFGLSDTLAARAAYETSLKNFELLGNGWGQALCYFGLATIAFRSRQLGDARKLVQRCLSIYESMGNLRRVVETREFAAELALQAGQPGEARQCFEANQKTLEEMGDRQRAAYFASKIAGLEST